MKNRTKIDESPGIFNVAKAWTNSICDVIARYARGNISAQYGRILFPEEQTKRRNEASKIAIKMHKRKRAA
jgi:hypothetical protein